MERGEIGKMLLSRWAWKNEDYLEEALQQVINVIRRKVISPKEVEDCYIGGTHIRLLEHRLHRIEPLRPPPPSSPHTHRFPKRGIPPERVPVQDRQDVAICRYHNVGGVEVAMGKNDLVLGQHFFGECVTQEITLRMVSQSLDPIVMKLGHVIVFLGRQRNLEAEVPR